MNYIDWHERKIEHVPRLKHDEPLLCWRLSWEWSNVMEVILLCNRSNIDIDGTVEAPDIEIVSSSCKWCFFFGSLTNKKFELSFWRLLTCCCWSVSSSCKRHWWWSTAPRVILAPESAFMRIWFLGLVSSIAPMVILGPEVSVSSIVMCGLDLVGYKCRKNKINI